MSVDQLLQALALGFAQHLSRHVDCGGEPMRHVDDSARLLRRERQAIDRTYAHRALQQLVRRRTEHLRDHAFCWHVFEGQQLHCGAPSHIRKIGEHAGNVYVVYANNDSGDGADIYFQRSTDEGFTFSSPLVLNSRPGSDRAQWFPWVAVDRATGRVHVFYYDQGIADSGDLSEVSWTWSDDGGRSWEPPRPLTDRPFHAGWGNDTGQPNLGDYKGDHYKTSDESNACGWLRFIFVREEGDALLLGTDLEKPIHQLLAAYDDPLGVTAAFDLNLLARINRELDADFILEQFEHIARFNPEQRSVEMHLRSQRKQTVTVPRAGLTVSFVDGETIWTESSHKYCPEELSQIAKDTGFFCKAQWIDQEWPFAENLFVAE